MSTEKQRPQRLRRRLFDILERDLPGDHIADAVHYFLIATVLLSVTGAVLATVPSLALREKWWFHWGEFTALVAFTVEYGARLWVAPEHPLRRQLPPLVARAHYAVTVPALIDLAAILPWLISLTTELDVHALLVLRLVRFLKLARYSSGFNALYLAVRRERYALLSCFIILCAGVLIAATAMYLTERDVQPDKFGSIPEAMWWAITTLTTVGYGDVVPVTTSGRVIGALTMVSGLVMLALPIAIIASSFSEVIAKHNFVVTFSMISRLPPFSDLDAPVLGDILPLLNSRSFDRGHQVVRRGESTAHLFVVLQGRLEMEGETGFRALGPGDVFGLLPGHTKASPVPVRAVVKSKILAIEENELHMLALRHPAVIGRLSAAARDRDADDTG
ncbi:cyclic nucleotide-gated ion channel/potassium channel family protein [Xanthobacter autotrophicus]|uniref:cyclic nucleotide-gated ion channel n=1 Tax=Xanthobacter TaxID=279 RepID=UPI0024AB7505|nr:cyclic nucleotide-gated ion channel [Xanthobacter autotrophicus]MDI4663299.1 cyclic nucleotide-gated ion channel/potassium channel family protein [Xanthobacter autotrophicus]